MTIGELSREVALPEHTLRYYEREGLMPAVPRDGGGRRVYGDLHRRWLGFLRKLRQTGMPLREVRAYVRCLERGADAERVALLRSHRERVRKELAELTEHLAILDRKIAAGCGPASEAKPPSKRRRQHEPVR
jgi:DNA-binding transcriptional MerR regulator